MASSWATVPPPAPEPMMTTTGSFSAIGLPYVAVRCPFVVAVTTHPPRQAHDRQLGSRLAVVLGDPRVGQPVQVVEPAVQVPALVERGSLVAQQVPDLVVVVQRDHGGGVHQGEEGGVGHLRQHRGGPVVVEPDEVPVGPRIEVVQTFHQDVVGPARVLDGLGRPLVRRIRESSDGDRRRATAAAGFWLAGPSGRDPRHRWGKRARHWPRGRTQSKRRSSSWSLLGEGRW